MKLNVTKRLSKEDFKPKDQELVEKLAFTLNQFMEQVTTALNKNLTINDNLPFETKSVNTSVDADGVPNTTLSFKTSFVKPIGVIVIKSQNIQDDTPITSAPFAEWTINNSIITITKINGIPDDTKFTLTLLIVS